MKSVKLKNILIGDGYIGSYIKKSLKIDSIYNSKTIKRLSLNNKRIFNIIYLAAPSSLKFFANKNPNQDKKNTNSLIKILKQLNCKKIIYISTTDTYSNFNSSETSRIIKEKLSYYGQNRFELCKFIKIHFKNYLIIKLPSIFGYFEKKGFLHDLINHKTIKFYNSKTSLQWFYLPYLIKEIKKINSLIKKKSAEINLISEPIMCKEINKKLSFNKIFENECKVYKYNIKTNFKKNKYFYKKEKILSLMKKYLRKIKKIN
jgi:hypothetical protein